MKKQFSTLNTVTTAMLIALGVVINLTLHNLTGKVVASLVSAMHLTVFICGILCGPILGLTCGVLSPLTAFVASGCVMPAFPTTLIPMIFELACYGLISGLLQNKLVGVGKKENVCCLFALATAMVVGRIIAAVVSTVILYQSGANVVVAWWTSFVHKFTACWVGIIIQLVAVPTLLTVLQKSGVLIKYRQSDTEK